ncbi:nucleotide-sugar transporter-domain-containing protein [Zopfochytrium polystomum]|nr:nucleotide-sugar transporter-domain-containing protein [Zopfochytrium polystomum]
MATLAGSASEAEPRSSSPSPQEDTIHTREMAPHNAAAVAGRRGSSPSSPAAPTASPPSLFGIPLSAISLVTLVVQYSTTIPTPTRYLASTAVVMSELMKLVICFAVTASLSFFRIANELFGPGSDCFKMMVPAALYVLQNNLQYLAVTNLDPATFQVSYQMKILTTALFSVWLLRRTLSRQKWLSLFLLTAGIALVQLPPSNAAPGKEKKEHSGLEKFVGLVAVAVACLSSGLAGVWFEKVLKGSKTSLWARNIQLSAFSLIPGLFIGVIFVDGAKVAANGFFQGYTAWTWAAVSCQAIGGLIVALVVKYADNILKGFATSISIILSAIASVFIFDFVISIPFVIGAAMVLYATHMYGAPEKPARESTSYTKVSVDEKA